MCYVTFEFVSLCLGFPMHEANVLYALVKSDPLGDFGGGSASFTGTADRGRAQLMGLVHTVCRRFILPVLVIVVVIFSCICFRVTPS